MNEKLIKAFMSCEHRFAKYRPHKQINDSLEGENKVLRFINAEGGSTYPKEIELAMGISSARVAAIIKKLEKRELVTRSVDQVDRRKTLVTLTLHGEKAAREIETKMMYALGQMFDALGEEDAQNFVRIMEKLMIHMPEIMKDCEEKLKEMDDHDDQNI